MRVPLALFTVVAMLRSADAGELTLKAPLQPAKLLGCVFQDGALRLPEPLPAQVGGRPIAVEAEAFRSVAWQNPPGGTTRVADAAGGQCVAFVSEAVYHVVVNHSGYYWYWQRAWIPRLASWSHSVQIDDAIPMDLRFGQRKGDKAQTWFWLKGTRHYLRRGVHTIAVRNLHNGKRLDRWVLTRDEKWTPDGTGPAACAVKSIDRGEFLSAPLAPLSLKAWRKLEVTAKGNAKVQAATGTGDFRPLPANGRLAGNAAPLRVRIVLRRDAKGASPEVALGNVTYVADADDFHILHNATMRLLLHKDTGRICGLQDPRTDRRYLPDGVPATLFELETKHYDHAEITTLSSDNATLTGATRDGQKLTLRHELADGKLRVTTTLDLSQDWMARLTLHVANHTDRDVIGATFPRLAQARAGADSTDDVLCFPGMSPKLIRQPGRAGTVTNPHPIRASIGFCDLHDAQGGLTLAPLDFPMVLTHFASTPDPSRQSTTLGLTRRDRVPAGGQATFTAGIGLHAGDWHAAADWYRDWFATHVGTPRIQPWVRDSDGWVHATHVEDLAGLGFVHMQLWRNTGHGGCPTYYYPNPAYRSEAQYTDLARAWRALGGHLGVYYHGNGTSRSYILADRIYGIPVADIPKGKRPETWDWFVRNSGYGPERKPVEKLDMSKIDEPARHEEYPTMCWQGGQFPRYLEKWAIGIWLKEYGLDTPYWDTLACRDRQDFSPFLRHNGEGRGAMARYRFLLDIQRKGTAVAPGFYQSVEGGSELLGLAAGQLMSNFVYGRNLEVARYTHPDQVYYIGHSNGWWTPPKTHLAACIAFYLNTKFDLIRLTPKVMEVVRTRRWLAPWLHHSRFLDTQGLSVNSPEIQGALHLHRGPRGDALIATFMNWQGVAGKQAAIDVGRYLKGKRIRAYAVTQTSEPAAIATQPRERWTLDIPTSPVSAVLLLAEPARALPVVQAQQLEAKQVIRVFDPAAKKRRFAVRIETAEAKFQPDPDGRLTLASEGATVFGREIAYADYASLTQRRHADITLTEGDLALRTRSLVAPHFVDPDFEDAAFDASEAHTGKRSLRLPPGKTSLRHFPLELIPGHRYRVSLWIKRLETKGHVYANVHHHLSRKSHTFGGRATPGTWQRVETVFEMKAGRDQPHLYLYNWQGTTKSAWFDTVQVTDLGLAQAKP